MHTTSIRLIGALIVTVIAAVGLSQTGMAAVPDNPATMTVEYVLPAVLGGLTYYLLPSARDTHVA